MANYPNLVSVTPNEVHSVTSPLAATWSFDQTFSVESAAGWFESDATGALTTIPLGQSGPFVLEVKAEQILCSEIRGTTVYVYQDNSINGRAYSGSAVAHPLGDAVTLIATSVQAQVITANSPIFTGVVTSPVYKATGLTGAAVAGRWVGNTVSGSPASGTFLLNDWVTSQDGNVYICTVAGTPGTWVGTAAANFTASSTVTLSNKRITKRVLASSANSATPTINTDNYDVVVLTGQTTTITSMTTNLTGTPVSGDKLQIAITGTSTGITWGASFEASTVALPSTTMTTARLDILFTWNATTSKWRVYTVS